MKSVLACTAMIGLLTVLGCDDEGSDPGQGAGGDGASGALGESGSGQGGAGEMDGGSMSCVASLEVDENPSSTAPVYLCDASESTSFADSDNACRNDADCAIIETDMVREIARNCGLGCRDMPDCESRRSCNRDCVVQGTNNLMAPGLTPDCADCYAEISACALEFCLSECAANADAPDCVFCQLQQGCRIPFERCSGLDRMN